MASLACSFCTAVQGAPCAPLHACSTRVPGDITGQTTSSPPRNKPRARGQIFFLRSVSLKQTKSPGEMPPQVVSSPCARTHYRPPACSARKKGTIHSSPPRMPYREKVLSSSLSLVMARVLAVFPSHQEDHNQTEPLLHYLVLCTGLRVGLLDALV